ncbi:MAG: thioredoxin domain-containing protein [Gemmatimonadaceae bacterium]
MLARRFLSPTPPINSDVAAQVRTVANWKDYGLAGLRVGPRDAKVTIVVFTDYGCRYCKSLALSLQKLVAPDDRSISVVYRNYPLRAITFEAALAAECAARAGKLDRMQRVLYARSDSFGLKSWSNYARAADIEDTLAFTQCLREPMITDRIAADVKAGESLFIRGTPAILVNSVLFDGRPSDEELMRTIKSAMR